MKPQLTGTKKRSCVSKAVGAEAALSLQEELVAAIHGAFEVAVEIAVQEVMKLVSHAPEDVYEEMRLENEFLKQRLQRAEALLDSARLEEIGDSSPSPARQFVTASNQTDQRCHNKSSQRSPNLNVRNMHGCTGVGGKVSPAGQSHANPPADPTHVKNEEKQRSGYDVTTAYVGHAASDPEKKTGCAVMRDAQTAEVTEEMSHVCVVKVESVKQSCRDLAAQDSLTLPSEDDRMTSEQVPVKHELEQGRDSSALCLNSVKVEDFSSECMLAVQSKMLEEWTPEGLDIQNHDLNSSLCSTRLTQAHPPNLTTNLPSPTDLPSFSPEYPNTSHVAEPASIPEAPSQVYGVHVRTGCNPSHTILYACKSCGQTFPLPSLLRRHHSLCQQRLQQCFRQPVAGSRRTRLQLYPPGCSPFRCTECNREFNRMENLKTHLRIHTGERPYTCSVCSMCFRHSGALTRHFRIHTGEKPYICTQCGKSFRNCGGLKFHQRSHSKQSQ